MEIIMAFNKTETPVSAEKDTSWKAQGFLNLYLPAKNGGRKKLGAIPLKSSRPHEAVLLEWLNGDPARAASLLTVLEIEYQSAEANPAAGFDLPIAEAAPVDPAAPPAV
jgi:hypothetical protein